MTEALTHEIEELRLLMGSPRDPHGRVFAQLGDALRRAGSLREALALLLDGVAEHPNFTPGHLVLAWTAQESGDLGVARAAYERTVQLDPDNPNGLFGLGSLLDRAGDPEGAAMMRTAEALDRRVRMQAPRLPLDADLGDATDGRTPLQDLPFLSLRDLAPDDVDLDDHLPFVPLDDLRPDEEPGELGDVELASLPFIPVDELAPDGPDLESSDTEIEAEAPAEASADPEELEGLPFVSTDELAPESGLEEVHDDAMPEAEDVHQDAMGEVKVQEDAMSEVKVQEDAMGEVKVQEDAVGEADGDAADDALDGVPSGTLVTRTMGELLVRQGLVAEAVDVFEQLVDENPDDPALESRLEELRGALSDPPSRGETTGAVVAPPDAAAAEAAHPSVDPPRPDPTVSSPFHMVDEDAEDLEAGGAPVGDYFGRLLTWSPRRPPETDDEGSAPS